ncbi:FAD-dependent oxidoreductase [Sinirhodobacter populi]|uniref:FAD-dependent oxidoreductase n=1 Tax=Paenirhodobacter populi TaxID=2306993 RepID=A0A443KI86_9RHOB|nr:FAD-dependent oxidoreductase [Sinirhodobacter populi]
MPAPTGAGIFISEEIVLIGRRITVIGAGIAGLAVARALALHGAVVTVLEQAEAIREVGAGLQISPNGARVLHALGLGQAFAAAGLRIEGIELYDGETDSRVVRLDLARLRPQAEYRAIHRARLVDILAQGARDAGVQIQLLQKIARVDLSGAHPVVETEQGERIEAELLIGADGLHSHVRAALNGPVAPFFTHQIAWRALIPCEAGAPPLAQVFMGAGRHLVSYPLANGQRNIVAVEERPRWVEESWSLRDDPLTLRAAFSDFCPRVRGWLAQVEEPGLWGLFRHPVAERWHGRGAVILGDAAHPTLPFMAQGASMALEDAWALAALLALHDRDEAALAAYQAARAARCAKIVEAANRNARNYHLRGVPRALGHLGMRVVSTLMPEKLIGRFDWIYDFDVTKE